MNRESLRQAFSQYPSGVAAIAAQIEGRVSTMLVSSLQVGISLEPPLILFAVQHTSTTWPLLKHAPRLGVSVLGESQEHLAAQLAGPAQHRLDGIATSDVDGAHVITDSPILMHCSIHAQHRAGDHDIVVLEVHDVVTQGFNPLVWHDSGFRALAKRHVA